MSILEADRVPVGVHALGQGLDDGGHRLLVRRLLPRQEHQASDVPDVLMGPVEAPDRDGVHPVGELAQPHGECVLIRESRTFLYEPRVGHHVLDADAVL